MSHLQTMISEAGWVTMVLGVNTLDKQGTFILISWDNEKEGIEGENDLFQTSKFPFSYDLAMQKMDDYLAYLWLSTKSHSKKFVTTCPIPWIFYEKWESFVKQTSSLFIFRKSSDIRKILYDAIYFR